MASRFRVVLFVLVGALVAVVLTMTSAQGALAKVSGITPVRADNYNAKLTVHWSAVPGATYQVRWAGSSAALARATVLSATTTTATSPPLNRCITNYVQVRALKGAVAGPWSAAKAVRFRNRGPQPPTLTGAGLPDAVKLSWNYATYATRYRVRWNAAPFGKFPGGDGVVGGSWTNQYARSVTLNLPTNPQAGDKMMGVAYANAVFAQIDVNNICLPSVIRHSPYIPVFPKAPDPGPGDKIRVGTYNVELFPSNAQSPGRINGIAKNITDHRLSVVSLQEANAATASSLLAKLDSRWNAVPPQQNSGQQILYDSTIFRAVDNGVFKVPNPKPGYTNLPTPWVRLRQVNPSSAQSQDLIVVAIHLAENASKTQMQKKHDVNTAANVALRNIDAINPDAVPVITAGDFRYLREPFNDVPGYVEGPPTFVRAGYYDAMAALVKNNIQYTTVNQHKNQVRSSSGVGTRADYIMLKGFRGSRAYTNVANWRYNGAFVSDHNLVYADVTIPYQ